MQQPDIETKRDFQMLLKSTKAANVQDAAEQAYLDTIKLLGSFSCEGVAAIARQQKLCLLLSKETDAGVVALKTVGTMAGSSYTAIILRAPQTADGVPAVF